MQRIRFKLKMLVSIVVLTTFIAPHISFAGSLKEKLQEKLNTSNIQFQGSLDYSDEMQFRNGVQTVVPQRMDIPQAASKEGLRK